jgi:hypothetical protein
MTAAPHLPAPRSLAKARAAKRRRAPAHLRLLPLFDRVTAPLSPLEEALADYCDASSTEGPAPATIPFPPFALPQES